jgi:hypothetical protein
MKKLILPLSLAILPVGLSAQLVLNEFLADPVNDLAGDANGDGTRDGSQDEFIELVNTIFLRARLSLLMDRRLLFLVVVYRLELLEMQWL